MTVSTHEPVMNLLRAALDPAGHRTGARSPAGLPTGRRIAAIAHADAADHGMIRLSLPASGTAMAALGRTAEIAARSGQSTDELLDTPARAAREQGDDQVLVVDVLRSMADGGYGGAAEILGDTFARDEGDFLCLLLNLADYCGTSIQALATRYGTPVEDTLAELDDALEDAAGA